MRYVLEGSIRKAGQRIRVTAQLIDGTSGAHIWAERYDRQLEDIFELQDEITATITAAIGPEIDQAERDRAQRLPPESLDVWELYQKGLWHLYRFTAEDNAESQRLFQSAIEIAPAFAPATAGLTHARYYAYMHGYKNNPSDLLDQAFASARAAVAADDRDADAHFALGRILYLKGDIDTSIAECGTATSHNPSFAHAFLGLGGALMYAGEYDQAIEAAERAIRLSPHDPVLWISHSAIALSHFGAGRLEMAELAGRQAVRHPRAEVTAYYILAGTLGEQGKIDEAARVWQQIIQLKPDFSAEFLRSILLFRETFVIDRLIEGLHKAGMPRPE